MVIRKWKVGDSPISHRVGMPDAGRRTICIVHLIGNTTHLLTDRSRPAYGVACILCTFNVPHIFSSFSADWGLADRCSSCSPLVTALITAHFDRFHRLQTCDKLSVRRLYARKHQPSPHLISDSAALQRCSAAAHISAFSSFRRITELNGQGSPARL